MTISDQLVDVLVGTKVPLLGIVIVSLWSLIEVTQEIVWAQLDHDKVRLGNVKSFV